MSSLEEDSTQTQETSFAEALPALKQQGCSVLVVGTTPEYVHEHACEQLLSTDSDETRRRLTVRAATNEGLGAQVTAESDTSRVIEYNISARTTAAEGAISTAPEMAPNETVDPDTPQAGAESQPPVAEHEISELENRITTTIADLKATAGTLMPAELRVCFGSIFPLLDLHSLEPVAELLQEVFTAVRDEQGMVHCHLPLAYEAEIVDELNHLFDAVVELRIELGCPRQRWHLREGPSSEWLPLDSPNVDTKGGNR